MSWIRLLLLSAALLVGLASQAFAQSWPCDESLNPHSFGCHENAYNGQTDFPLVETDLEWARGDWFAVSYATPFGNSGDGFAMDVDPSHPQRPRRGVMNIPAPGRAWTVMGTMHIQGFRATFDNWQNAPMTSIKNSLHATDEATIEWQSVDQWNFTHLFQCRTFIRHDTEHLTCRWMIWENAYGGPRWRMAGYFGFLRKDAWDSFVNGGNR